MRKLYGNHDASLFAKIAQGEPPSMERETVDAPGVAAGAVDETVRLLQRDGFAVLPGRLDDAACADLERTARRAECDLVGGDAAGGRARFDERAPLAVRYDVPEDEVVRSVAAQRLIADRSLFQIASRYLGMSPVQDLVAMWWSTPAGEGASAAAAQQFHFDLDRLSFVKVFVFLTDVDQTTGPHEYVRGSHRSTPQELRRDRRHSDGEVLRAFHDDVVSIEGLRGTIFLADTRGLHKGRHLERGHRLVFQTEYATSLFGAPFSRVVVDRPHPDLADMAAQHPASFDRFDLRG
jgi:hypothetical protein